MNEGKATNLLTNKHLEYIYLSSCVKKGLQVHGTAYPVYIFSADFEFKSFN